MTKSDFGSKTSTARLAKTSNTGDQAFVEALSPGMRAVEMVIHELAQSDVPVLLLGEAGSGKRTIARRIHENSHENTANFRIFKCAGMTSESFQELHAPGHSAAGTVFLQEIADLDASCQTRLLQSLSTFAKR